MNGLTFMLPLMAFIACAVYLFSEIPEHDEALVQLPCKWCGYVIDVNDYWLRHYKGVRCDNCARWNPAYGGHDFPEGE